MMCHDPSYVDLNMPFAKLLFCGEPGNDDLFGFAGRECGPRERGQNGVGSRGRQSALYRKLPGRFITRWLGGTVTI